MKDKYILTAESVTAGHPDKLCDTIADSVLDACLKEDPNARVACEVLATVGKILVAGELRTTASPDVETIVRQAVQRAGYDCNYHVEVRLHTQSPDIAEAVDGETLGAGDQGIMYGYACWETVELLPAPVVLANRITSLLTTCREEKLISGIGPDGKAQVSVQYAFGVPERVDTIVISCQHDADKDPTELREELRRLVIDRACHDLDGVRLSCVQFFTASALSILPMLLLEKPSLAAVTSAWLPIVYAGVFSGGVGYTLQILGQQLVPPTLASMILSLESVFAVLFGWLILHQALSARELLGCLVIFIAIVIAQLPSKDTSAA